MGGYCGREDACVGSAGVRVLRYMRQQLSIPSGGIGDAVYEVVTIEIHSRKIVREQKKNKLAIDALKFKMHKVVKAVVVDPPVVVPISALDQRNLVLRGNAQNEAGKQCEALAVLPVQGIRANVDGMRRQLVMRTVGPLDLAMAGPERLVLVALWPVAADDRAVDLADNMIENAL